jgi:hypothetical protein
VNLLGVSHVYANGKRALDRVTLSIPRGMYGLLDQNGRARDRGVDGRVGPLPATHYPRPG